MLANLRHSRHRMNDNCGNIPVSVPVPCPPPNIDSNIHGATPQSATTASTSPGGAGLHQTLLDAKVKAIADFKQRSLESSYNLFLECNEAMPLGIDDMQEYLKMAFLTFEFDGRRMDPRIADYLAESLTDMLRSHPCFTDYPSKWEKIMVVLTSILDELSFNKDCLFVAVLSSSGNGGYELIK